MEKYRLYRNILCIDLKSFYASVECALLGLDPFKTPLVVADKSRGEGSIVLAVSPYLKNLGLPSRCRIYELPTDTKIIFRKPQMKAYLEYSVKIIEIYLSFISEEDLFIYSIDEAFLDLTEYISYYNKSDYEIAQMILAKIYEETKIFATCGIGKNMLMAKLALDLESKNAPNFIAKWTYEDIKTKLWPTSPLSKMWGIGKRLELRLNRLGLAKIGDIANYNLDILKRNFGIIGEELYYHSHGIDMSMIQEKQNRKIKQRSLGSGQTLFFDYFPPMIFLIIREMADDISHRLRKMNITAKTIYLSIGYSKTVGGGFSKQFTLDYPTSSSSTIYDYLIYLFHKHYEDEPIRRVSVAVTNLTKQNFYQFSLFEDENILKNEHLLGQTIDEIKQKYGKNSINRAQTELEGSTLKSRNEMIGGHHE